MRLPEAGPAGVAAEPGVRFGVVHEDPLVAVVDKPAGLVVHPGRGAGRRMLVGVCSPAAPTWPNW